jgi:hypothetical protein
VNHQPYVPPGAQEKTTQQLETERQLTEMQKRAQAVQQSQRALLYSPLGLRNLFPTNRTTVRIKKKASKGQPSELEVVTPQSEFQQAVQRQADELARQQH